MLKTVDEEGWQVVTDTWWHTRYETVSWAYNQNLSAKGKGKRLWFQGSLFNFSSERLRRSSRKRDTSNAPQNDLTLSGDLSGVQCAIDVLAPYEADVGFSSVISPSEQVNQVVDLSVEVDEGTISHGKKKWDLYAQVLTCGFGGEGSTCATSTFGGEVTSRTSSPSSSQGDLHHSTSTMCSIDSTDSDLSAKSISVPSTPKGKSAEAVIQVKDASPSKSDKAFYISQNRRLNAYASSFVPSKAQSELIPFPTSVTPIQHFPNRSSTVDVNIFSSELAPLATVKITKDEHGFYSGAEVASPVPQNQRLEHSSFLPPFLQESPRRKTSLSKTRAIVDRLRSSHSHSHSPGPNPPLYDMSLFDERIYVSEDDRARSSGISSPSSQDEEDEGWINLTKIDKAARESKATRTRNLFLALTRRRSDPASTNETQDHKAEGEDRQALEAPVVTSPTSLASPLPTPDCGWIDGSSLSPSPSAAAATRQHRQSESRPRSHKKRRSTSSATLPPPPTSNVNFPQFVHSTNTLRNSSGLAHTPFHPPVPYFSASQAPASGFYPAYPSMMSPITYTTYIQQLHAIQMQIRRSAVPQSSVDWAAPAATQYPTSGVGQFATSTFSQPVSLTSGPSPHCDSLW